MSTLKVDAITDTSGGTNVDVPNAAKAWVNFNGTGTVAIREDYNVSSITDNGTGNYTVNFTTAMPDANYSAIPTASLGAAQGIPRIAYFKEGQTRSTTATTIYVEQSDGSAHRDNEYVEVAIFR